MLEGIISLASYSFSNRGLSGGAFGNLLDKWDQMGVFTYMLPFLLIFSIVYGILSKVNIFGENDNKTVNAIIALVVGLMAIQVDAVPLFFADILPRLGIALAGVLVFLILMGLFAHPENKGLMNTLMWGSLIVALIVVLQSLDIFGVSYSGDYFLKFIPYDWLPWIAILVLVGLVIGSSKSKSITTPDGPLVRALKGE